MMGTDYLNPLKDQPGWSSRYGCLRSSAAVGRKSGSLGSSSLPSDKLKKKNGHLRGKALQPEVVR